MLHELSSTKITSTGFFETVAWNFWRSQAESAVIVSLNEPSRLTPPPTLASLPAVPPLPLAPVPDSATPPEPPVTGCPPPSVLSLALHAPASTPPRHKPIPA